MKDLEAIFGKIVHSSGSIEYLCWLILRPQNGWNKVVSFFSEIKLARLLNFENVTTISDPMALHSVQLPSWKRRGGEVLNYFKGFLIRVWGEVLQEGRDLFGTDWKSDLQRHGGLVNFIFSCPYHGRDSIIYLFLKEEVWYLSFFIIIIIIVDNNNNKQWEKNLNPLHGIDHMHLLWIVHKQLTCYFITTCCSCNCTSWLYDNPAPLRFCKRRPPRLNLHHLLSGCRLTNKRKMINFTLTIRNMFSYI